MALIALFPGQGSQVVGMLTDMAQAYPEIGETFSEASDSLGYDLWSVAKDGPAERLAATEITQPLMLTAGISLLRAWLSSGGKKPSIMAGHSLGEYTALTAAGAITLFDAVRLVRSRGQFMQDAVPAGTGAMAAVIGLDDRKIEVICEEVSLSRGQVVEAVNYNAPGQLVVAGHLEAVEACLPRFKEAGAKRALLLPVSAPFHCTLMRPAADRLERVLKGVEFKSPSVPIIQNVSIQPETDVSVIRKHLIKQTFSPVRWADIIQSLGALGVEHACEFGPGAVLSGLGKRIKLSPKHWPTGNVSLFQEALASLGVSG